VPIVFKRAGSRTIKQEVVTGAMNDDEVVIVKGLDEGDTILLTPPPDRETLELQRLPGSVSLPPGGAAGDTAQRTPVPSPSPSGKPAAPSAPVRKG
jgi:hypothetical protein